MVARLFSPQWIGSLCVPIDGNFVAILFKKLDLDIINQGEIERMFLTLKESTTMGLIMATL
ncbi:MATH and LRR domain-containing protein PFE0570w-like [Aphis craccivora]|uniref:MATH and LRR domain-containing protein PFE0570w-like n=1 Tax=Aphis craccivora TaxID=307492 RepID=A0A6G0Y3S0_APHCR|nr:MATH and LRR domain-containing protein PFE0570w-like [Aphis craccivora]